MEKIPIFERILEQGILKFLVLEDLLNYFNKKVGAGLVFVLAADY